LTGWVRNSPAGVAIEAQGSDDRIDLLIKALGHEAPPLAVIGSITQKTVPLVEGESGFTILSSGDGVATAEIPPDIDLCDDCLSELFDPTDRRYRYPFITCTNCGPRYSIITGLPYDRPLTTMAGFPLCDACRAEYMDPGDRRFHAQPVACHACGPQLQLVHPDGREAGEQGEASLQAAIRLLREGRIIALKGAGGYHLAVDAGNSQAVQELRRRKHRKTKPFAVMVRDITAAKEVSSVDTLEERLLSAPERPIVLLRKRDAGSGTGAIAHEVAPDSNYLGVMLPSTPLHHLLLNDFGGPLVMTSGNRASEPVAFEDDEALQHLAAIADAFLAHDRPIRTRVDDSVVRVFRGNPLFIRRSRGYAPRAVQLAEEGPSVLPWGASLKGLAA
jgi:hydrogenase maturation protein HypF